MQHLYIRVCRIICEKNWFQFARESHIETLEEQMGILVFFFKKKKFLLGHKLQGPKGPGHN